MPREEVGVIGAGLGGLLAGLGLAREGCKVAIFERLPYAGGRFANTERNGYRLSTGALHMIPHGERGCLAKMLRSLGAGVPIITSKPEGLFRINGRDYLFEELPKLFSAKEKLKLAAMLTSLKLGRGSDENFREWIEKRMKNELLLRIADSFCGWALSVDSGEVSAGEMAAITKNVNKFGGPGIPLGGCGGVTKALVREFEKLGGKIFYRAEVERIEVEDSAAKGLATKEDNHDFDIIISDVGPKATVKLCGEENFPGSYVREIKNVQEAAGIKISIACKRAMLGHSGVLFTPQAQRIDGLNEVTNADPSLAPKGKHLLMSHQALDALQNATKEAKLGIEDLHAIFPDFDKHCKVLAVQVYKSGWPVNRAISGVYVSPETPIKNLYCVGDAIKPKGWMESEGVAAGVELLLKHLQKSQGILAH